MAPGLTAELPIQTEAGLKKEQSYPKPLKLSGVLDGFEHDDVTPLIGREYPKVNIVDDLLNASNADELLRDVAITSELPAQPPPPILPSPVITFFLYKKKNFLGSSPLTIYPKHKSLNVASSFSAPKITSPASCKRNSCTNSAS